jgi:hypothetical protein
LELAAQLLVLRLELMAVILSFRLLQQLAVAVVAVKM